MNIKKSLIFIYLTSTIIFFTNLPNDNIQNSRKTTQNSLSKIIIHSAKSFSNLIKEKKNCENTTQCLKCFFSLKKISIGCITCAALYYLYLYCLNSIIKDCYH